MALIRLRGDRIYAEQEIYVSEGKNGKNFSTCPVCGGPTKRAGAAAYYDQSARYRTPVCYCRSCDVLYREVEDRQLVSHYYAASYVREKNEERLWQSRVEFFQWILALARKDVTAPDAGRSGPPTLLDFGSAYGHLLSLAQAEGLDPVGVELNEDLVKQSRAKGLVVYQRLDEVPGRVDIVTAIDSFYCVPNPREVIITIRDKLKPSGVLLLRITNRNLFARLRARFARPGDLSAIGDATVSYSLRGITQLLHSSGWRILRVIPDYGKGKRLPTGKRLSYLLGYLLTLLLWKRRILTPGLIVVARPSG